MGLRWVNRAQFDFVSWKYENVWVRCTILTLVIIFGYVNSIQTQLFNHFKGIIFVSQSVKRKIVTIKLTKKASMIIITWTMTWMYLCVIVYSMMRSSQTELVRSQIHKEHSVLYAHIIMHQTHEFYSHSYKLKTSNFYFLFANND